MTLQKLVVTCVCPNCGHNVPINKKIAAQVLRAGRKEPTKEQYSAAGKAGMLARWGNLKK